MNKVSRAIWNELLPRSPVFSTAEVAELSGVALANASRALTRLERRGMVARIRRGLWAVPSHPEFSAYAVVPHLFKQQPGGYVSLLSALNLHGMIDQIPRVVHVVTTSHRPDLRTSFATFEFYRIQRVLFGGFKPYLRTGNFDIATPEKTLFDALYFSARKGRRFTHLPEVELPANFSVAELKGWIRRIDAQPLRIAVEQRWQRLAHRVLTSQG